MIKFKGFKITIDNLDNLIKSKKIYIYKIVIDNEFTYIGRTSNPLERLGTHLGLKKRYRNTQIFNAMKNAKTLTFEVLDECEESESIELEAKYISEYDTIRNGLNIRGEFRSRGKALNLYSGELIYSLSDIDAYRKSTVFNHIFIKNREFYCLINEIPSLTKEDLESIHANISVIKNDYTWDIFEIIKDYLDG